MQQIEPLQDTNSSSPDERWALVHRITASRGFAKASQIRELLIYLARVSIENPGVEVNDQDIGSRVLGRRPNYDTQADNIVRVQVRHLRQRLEEYFGGDGKDEPVVLTIPKGQRTVVFETRASRLASEPASSRVVPSQPRPRPYLLIGVAAVFIIAAVAAAFYAGRSSAGQPAQVQVHDAAHSLLWKRLFNHDQPTTIVIADSTLVMLQDLLETSISLDEYTSGAYRKQIDRVSDLQLRDALSKIAGRQHTSLADATLSARLYAIGRSLTPNVAVRYTRNMNVRDFNSGNFILIGSRRSIPWIDLFDSDLNFWFERFGPERRFGFRNRHPAPGEAQAYTTLVRSDGQYEAFASIALLPNATRTGAVLMLSGVSMEATEGAGEFTMSNDFDKLAARIPGAAGAREIPFFEAVIKTQAVSGAPHKAEIVAIRKHSLD